MSKTVYVSGASDDLVEVAGDVSLEGTVPSSDTTTVTVNGTLLLKLTFDDEGVWRLEAIGEVPGVQVTIVPTPGEDVPRDPKPPHGIVSYSDYAVVTGDIRSIEVEGDSWSA